MRSEIRLVAGRALPSRRPTHHDRSPEPEIERPRNGVISRRNLHELDASVLTKLGLAEHFCHGRIVPYMEGTVHRA